MKAMENLASLTPELSTHSFKRKNGEDYGLVMLHEDGVGLSRLLLEVWLEEVFPDGYSVRHPRTQLRRRDVRRSVQEGTRERREGRRDLLPRGLVAHAEGLLPTRGAAPSTADKE